MKILFQIGFKILITYFRIIKQNILYCKMDQKIISVIGGSGFIGSYLIDKLLELGYYVKIISRKPIAKKKFFFS